MEEEEKSYVERWKGAGQQEVGKGRRQGRRKREEEKKEDVRQGEIMPILGGE